MGTRVEVQLKRRTIIGPGRSEPAIVFTLINHSGHAVKITHLGMEPIEKGGEAFFFFPAPLPYGTPGPHEIPPRDAITLYQPPDTLGTGDPGHKTRARVTTSDGKTFRSKRVRVRDLTDPSGG